MQKKRQLEILYKAQINEFVSRTSIYEANKHKAHALLWKQCHKGLQAKIESRKDYTSAKMDSSPLALLKAIQEHSLSYEETKYEVSSVLDAMKNFINLKQKDDETLLDYTNRFKTARDIFRNQLGARLYLAKMAQADPDWDDNDETKQGYVYDNSIQQVCGLLVPGEL